MKFFIYSRKSVCTGKGESIENQIEMCRQYIDRKFPDSAGGEISVYEDEGFSAKNAKRPQFQQMLRDLKTDAPDYIVCYRLDRISRNVSDFSALIESLNQLDISFICIKEEFDTSKPMGKAMMYIASVFAQLERETIAERVRDNMLLLARTGRWLGGTPPTGYTSERTAEILIDGKSKTACRLTENPRELRTVKRIFDLYLQEQSLSSVSRTLARQGIKSRNGNTYSPAGIKEILQNPVYCTCDKEAFDYFTAAGSDVCFEEKDCSGRFGLLSYNKRDYTKKHVPRHSMDKWIIAPGKHPGLISGKDWTAVQKIIADNVPTGNRPSKVHSDCALLSGMIYCSRCGGRMFAKRRVQKDAEEISYDYICSTKLHGGCSRCGCQNLSGIHTDNIVWEQLISSVEQYSDMTGISGKIKSGLEKERAQNTTPDFFEKQIQQCQKEADRLIELLSQNSSLSPLLIQRANARISQLEQEISSLSVQRTDAARRICELSPQNPECRQAAEDFFDFKEFVRSLSLGEKRALIKLAAEKILWDGTDLHIFISKS